MNERLIQITDNIFKEIADDNPSISLMGGSPGLLLFKLYYLKHRNNNELSEPFIKEVRLLSEAAINYNNTATFSTGQAGANWFFTLLYRQGFLDKTDYNTICSSNGNLAIASLDYLSKDNFDFLHGAIGIAYYFLYLKKKAFLPFFDKFLEILTHLMDKGGGVLFDYDFDTHEAIPNKFNPSLSHGLSSILKFCIECYQGGIYKRRTRNLARRIVKFLLSVVSTDPAPYCYFPNAFEPNSKDNQNSRLSWCYGDLTIAYILYQYGVAFSDGEVKNKALEILYHSAKRRTDENAGLVDAGLCHGSAGVGYIFSKLWHMTSDPVFLDAADFWFQRTIDYAVEEEGIAGFRHFQYITQKRIKDPYLLEGVAGIGLAILSHLYQDYSWDYCLMLND